MFFSHSLSCFTLIVLLVVIAILAILAAILFPVFAQAREKARQLIDFVTLSRLADQPARMLSGGQRKLLELARVLMAEPSVILLDEPAAGVNPSLLETIIGRIAELNRGGMTCLLFEHNMDMVMQLCRPIVVMAQGRVIFEGEPDGVRGDPRVLDAYLGDVAA